MQILRTVYEFFRYDVPYGIRNIIRFFPSIWQYRSWDYLYNLMLLRESLHKLHNAVEMGHEIDETRLPKLEAMQRVLTILEHIVEDEYIGLAEQEKGALSPHGNWFRFTPCEEDDEMLRLEDTRDPEAQQHDKAVFDYARQLEEQEWDELWKIFAGSEDIPGSDMRGWWD